MWLYHLLADRHVASLDPFLERILTASSDKIRVITASYELGVFRVESLLNRRATELK